MSRIISDLHFEPLVPEVFLDSILIHKLSVFTQRYFGEKCRLEGEVFTVWRLNSGNINKTK